MRISHILTAVSLLASFPAPVLANTLIGFTDGSPLTSAGALLNDTRANWAVQWTQSVAADNVTVSAILSSNIGPVPGNWWITDALGPGTTPMNIIASGTYIAPTIALTPDFNGAPRTVLGTGLDFVAGTYFLVLDGPPGEPIDSAEWRGDYTGVATTLAPGFAVGSYFSTTSPNTFGPGSAFNLYTGPSQFVFELATPGVPEPATWALLISGFGLAGWRMRIWQGHRTGSNADAAPRRSLPNGRQERETTCQVALYA